MKRMGEKVGDLATFQNDFLHIKTWRAVNITKSNIFALPKFPNIIRILLDWEKKGLVPSLAVCLCQTNNSQLSFELSHTSWTDNCHTFYVT